MSTVRSIVFAIIAFCLFTFASTALADVNTVFDEIHGTGEGEAAMVRLITDNVEAWFARWHVIENAKSTIDCTYFIMVDDVFGRSMVGLLLKKAREGVKIRLMMDARGTKGYARALCGRDLVQELIETGNAEVRVFNPVHQGIARIFKDLRQPVASNHDKLVIVDSQWVITGGRNISAAYFGDPEDDPDVYRDTDVLLKGSQVASQATAAFDVEFQSKRIWEIKKELLGNWDSQYRTLELARRCMQSHIMGMPQIDPDKTKFADEVRDLQEKLAKYKKMRWYSSFRAFRGERAYPTKIVDKTSVITDHNDLTPTLIKFIDNCETEILIQNPYVVLTTEAREALNRAASRGVAIKIVTNSPESSDSLLTQAMFVKEWKRVLADVPTCRIFAFTGKHKLHAKVFVFDRKISVVGTYNLDPLSEQVNSEEVAVVKSTAFAGQNFHRIQADTKHSIEYKIRISSTGEIEQVVGPSDHCTEAALGAVQRLGNLSFLRPLI